MFTVRRLVSDRLARSLSCTNSIESMISIVRTTTGVKRWKDIPTHAVRAEVACRVAEGAGETVTAPEYDQAAA
jgi:hypothetical protein